MAPYKSVVKRDDEKGKVPLFKLIFNSVLSPFEIALCVALHKPDYGH